MSGVIEGQANGGGREPSPAGTARLVMGSARAAYGAVTVVPSPEATMENVPALLEV
jgi:hypothetical protein